MLGYISRLGSAACTVDVVYRCAEIRAVPPNPIQMICRLGSSVIPQAAASRRRRAALVRVGRVRVGRVSRTDRQAACSARPPWCTLQQLGSCGESLLPGRSHGRSHGAIRACVDAYRTPASATAMLMDDVQRRPPPPELIIAPSHPSLCLCLTTEFSGESAKSGASKLQRAAPSHHARGRWQRES